MVKNGKDQHNWCTVSNKDHGLEQDCCHRQGQKACRNFVNNFILHLNNCWTSLNGLKLTPCRKEVGIAESFCLVIGPREKIIST